MLQKFLCCLFFMPLPDLSKSKCNFIVHHFGPGIFTIAFRQAMCKSFRSFLPKHFKINPSSGIRLKRQICLHILGWQFISIFSFGVLQMFLSNARKPSLFNHLTSVFVVHLSVLVVSDLWDDCNRKNIQLFFPFFTMTQHPCPLRGMTTFRREWVQSFNVSNIAGIYEYACMWERIHFFPTSEGLARKYFCHLRKLRVPPSIDTMNVPWVFTWCGVGRVCILLEKQQTSTPDSPDNVALMSRLLSWSSLERKQEKSPEPDTHGNNALPALSPTKLRVYRGAIPSCWFRRLSIDYIIN